MKDIRYFLQKQQKRIIYLLLAIFLLANLTACTKNKTYKINFVSCGEIIKTEEHSGTFTLELPTPASKFGFIFDGWFFDDGIFKKEVTKDSFKDRKIDREYSIFAKWRKLSLAKLEFETNGGKELEDKYVEVGQKCEPPACQKEGYEFLGWHTTNDLNFVFDFTKPIEKDAKLHAKWIKIGGKNENCTIEIMDQDAKFLEVVAKYGKTIDFPPLYKKEYRLENLYVDKACKNLFDRKIIVTNGFKLYAKWEKVTGLFSVNYHTNFQGIETIQLPYGTKVENKQYPRKDFEFLGWYKDENLSEKFDFSKEFVGGNITLYAKWKEKEHEQEIKHYNITLVLNGGKLGDKTENVVVTFIYGTKPTLQPPIKENANFAGWYYDKELTNAFSLDENCKINSDYTLYANWNEQVKNEDFQVEMLKGNQNCKILKYLGKEKNVIIPDTIGNAKVISLEMGCFQNNTTIESITLTPNVKTIFDNCFNGCTALSKFYSSQDNITYVGNYAFYGTNIKSFSFSKLTYIGEQAFANSNIEEITILGTPTIKETAFVNCQNLRNVIMVDITKIFDNMFQTCKNIESFVGDKIVFIGNNAFKGCNQFATINLANVETIGSGAFAFCNLKTANLASIKQLNVNAFQGNTALKDIFIGKEIANLREENGGCFNNCPIANFVVDDKNAKYSSVGGNILNKNKNKLVQIGGVTEAEHTAIIPGGVVTLGRESMRKNHFIFNLQIPNSLTTFEPGSLSGLPELDNFILNQDNNKFELKDNYLFDKETKTLVKGIPTKIANAITKTFVIPSEVKQIGFGAFEDAKYLETIRFSDTIETINAGAFYNCKTLVKLENTTHIKQIDANAFYGTTFAKLDMFENVSTISDFAFAYMDNLQSITFGSQVSRLEANIFVESDNIGEIILQSNSMVEINFQTTATIKVKEELLASFQEKYPNLTIESIK